MLFVEETLTMAWYNQEKPTTCYKQAAEGIKHVDSLSLRFVKNIRKTRVAVTDGCSNRNRPY